MHPFRRTHVYPKYTLYTPEIHGSKSTADVVERSLVMEKEEFKTGRTVVVTVYATWYTRTYEDGNRQP
ncbi:hypothetical protein MGYG_05362 [Nannizzia gypsea CBS 118893]|uniref:Uncharacterized protein n=1 Tax=Arthroderma gypseum (strain ATCC MYA-4604 / CBS 118893) TaxID=535722 RepID=E4UVN9_ARTGP|nr:hypothetical protein MGYG_05362 [Nannizzia gypsea CBS 118893]EFR02366.1 hypothetical protein MGYG_05362 [Nannizzia gypsea CBS 118893]